MGGRFAVPVALDRVLPPCRLVVVAVAGCVARTGHVSDRGKKSITHCVPYFRHRLGARTSRERGRFYELYASHDRLAW